MIKLSISLFSLEKWCNSHLILRICLTWINILQIRSQIIQCFSWVYINTKIFLIVFLFFNINLSLIRTIFIFPYRKWTFWLALKQWMIEFIVIHKLFKRLRRYWVLFIKIYLLTIIFDKWTISQLTIQIL